MSLRDDVQAGLKAIDAPNARAPLTLNAQGSCTVTVPIPPQLSELTDGRLLIQVQVSRTGQFFTMRSPLAGFSESLSAAACDALLQRVNYPDQVAGLSVAISAEDTTLVAIYHWILDSITPAQFTAVFTKFSTGMLDLTREIAAMARRDRTIKPIHPRAG